MRMVRSLAAILTVACAAGVSLRAQAPVTTADLARLESTVTDIDAQAVLLKKTDPSLSADVGKALADLRDEVAYLRVKLRREGAVARTEYADVRDRLETLRLKAQGEKVYAQPARADSAAPAHVLPVGTQFDVRLATPLTSRTAKVEQPFEYGWSHGLGEIVTALAAAGLRIDFLHERPFLEWEVPFLTEREPGRWRLPEGQELPLSFSLRATKPA